MACDRADPECEPGCVRVEAWRGARRLLCTHLPAEFDVAEADCYIRHFFERHDQPPVTRPQLVLA